MIENKEYFIIKNSGLFDEDWYCSMYSEVTGDPIQHYLDVGVKLNYCPSPDFDTKWYLDHYVDVKNSKKNPFAHYIKSGQFENRFPNSVNYYEENPIPYDDFKTNMKILIDSGLFDEKFYLEKYSDVKNSSWSGLEHYVRFGCMENNRDPNPTFSNSFYKEYYLKDYNSNWNPLTHYCLIGQFKNFKSNIFDIINKKYNQTQVNRILNAFENPVSIIIPLFDGDTDEFFKCLKSIKENTFIKHNIFVINYSFNNIGPIDENVKVFNFNSDEFYPLVYKSIFDANYDIVFLSSYTEVTYRWLEKLVIKAYSDENIDCVTPLSNSFQDFSPEYFNSTIKPPYLTFNGLSTLIEKSSFNENIKINFCNALGIYIKIKTFSLENFNKQSLIFDERGIFGWNNIQLNNVIDDSTYIYHNPKFFCNVSDKLNEISSDFKSIESYEELFKNKQLNKILKNIEYLTKFDYSNLFLNRILFIVSGDELNFCNDFLNMHTKNQFDFYYLIFNKNKIELWDYIDKNPIKLEEWNLKINRVYLRNDIIKNIYFNIINSYNINIVHINNFEHHSFDLVDLTNALEIPLILDCNDSFYLDTLDNLYQDSRYLGIFKQDWFKECDYLFNSSNTIIMGNENIKYAYSKQFNIVDSLENIFERNILDKVRSKLLNYKTTDSIKILIPGDFSDLSDHLDLIKNIKIKDKNNLLEFHYFSKTPFFEDFGINHGDFSLDLYNLILKEVSPNFICLFSVFVDVFKIMDMVKCQKIPIIAYNDDLLIDLLDGLDAINLLNGNTTEELVNNFFDFTTFENYYLNIKELYLRDDFFKKYLVNFNKFYEDIYLNDCDSTQKIFYNNIHFKNVSSNKSLFSNFDGFLANSYVSPVFEANFPEEFKQCFAVMDNISKYLINNVRESTSMPLISVIMPVYNREDVILYAVNSVLNQTYDNFELIIIDDCSTDKTRDILMNIDDDRIKLLFQDTNNGPSEARNFGLHVASGDYVAYLDSDNEWDSRYLESMLGAFFELPDADALYSGQLLYETYGSNPFAIRFASYNKSLLFNRNYIDLNCFCHKLNIFNEMGGFDTNLKRLEDWDFILRISNNYKMYSVPILFSKYYYYNSENRVTFAPLNTLNYSYLVRENNEIKNKNLDYNLKKKVNIIIPNYESLNDLRECIDVILSFNLDLIKIIIVDNNSNDAVKFYLNSLKNNDKIEVILNDVNYGFTHAVNIGIGASDSDADILLLNNDAILTGGSIESLQKFAYLLPDCGITVPQQILPAGTPTMNVHVPFASPIHECDVNPSQHHSNIEKIPIFHDGEFLELSFAPFFCTYIKREVLDNSLGLDAELGRHYRSDRIFSEYVRHVMGLKIYHISDAHVYHKLQKATNKLRKNKGEFDIMFVKNQWEPELMKKLNFNKALWDD